MRTWILIGLAIASAGCVEATADDAAEPALRTLAIEEIAANGDPDWFEVVNTTDEPIDLSAYVFVDAEGDLERAAAFPEIVLPPGGKLVQVVLAEQHGFRLGREEELYVYRACDGRLSDGVDW